MTTEVIVIAAVMIGAALVLRMFLDNRDRKRAEEQARMRGDRSSSVSLTPMPLKTPGRAFYDLYDDAIRDGAGEHMLRQLAVQGGRKVARDMAEAFPSPESPRSPQPAPGQ